jgi:nucleotide-binding universal stress UspA family protein
MVRYRTVLVAYDGSTASQRALEAAIDLAREGAEVIGVSVRAPTGDARNAQPSTELQDMIATITGPVGVRLPTELRTGHPAQEILAAARSHRADLIIIGRSGGSNAWGRVLGATAQEVSRRAECSVLIVP